MLERLIYYSALALSRLPWGLLYGVSSALSWLAFRLKFYRWETVWGNLALAFPEKSEAERRRIARGFYRHLTDSMVETLKMLTVSDAALRRRVDFAGWDQLREEVDARRPVVLYLGHYGNWEMVPTIVWAIPKEFVCAQIYKPMHHSLGHRVWERVRNRFGALNIPQKSAYYRLLQLQRAGQISITGFIADQRPNGGFRHWTRFLGLPTAYVVGGEEIGRRIDAAYYYLDIDVAGRGRSLFTLKKVWPAADEPDYPMTVGYLRMLEATIRRNPAPWLWSHKRWAGQLDHKFENIKEHTAE